MLCMLSHGIRDCSLGLDLQDIQHSGDMDFYRFYMYIYIYI